MGGATLNVLEVRDLSGSPHLGSGMDITDINIYIEVSGCVPSPRGGLERNTSVCVCVCSGVGGLRGSELCS